MTIRIMSVIIRLQNLPWNANALDIRQFFYGLSIPDGGVHIIGGDKGDAFIAFSTDEDARRAMMNDGGKINDHPIRLFLSSKTEMQNVILEARGAPPPPTGPGAKEPFGRAPIQEGFGGGGPGSMGGYDFHDQRNRGGPPPGMPAPMPPFGMGGDKRDGRPLGLGQSNPRFSGGPDYGGGEMRPGPDIGVRSLMDRSPGFGGRGSFDMRPSMDSKFPLSDPSGGSGGPLRGFGGTGDQMGGGQKGGPFQELGSHPASSGGGHWGFSSAARDGPGSGFGDRGFLEQDRNKDFARDVMGRDMPNRVGGEFSSPEKGRLLGNQEAGRFGFGREFGRPEDSREFGREEFGREFRKFHDQPGRPDPAFEFRRNDEFGQREPGREFDRPEFGGRRDSGRPEPGLEFGRGINVGRVEGGFPRDDRLHPFDGDRGIGARDFARPDGAGDFLRPNAGRDFGMPEAARDPMGGDMGRDFNDRSNLRPGFPRPDGPRDFSRPEVDRSFSGPDLRSNLPRGDLGRGEPFSRPGFSDAGPLGFGRDEPEGARLGSRSMDPGFPRDIPPFGRNIREDGPGFGGPGGRGPNLESGPFGLPEGEPRHPQQLGDGWRDQRERDLPGFAGRRMTPPREMDRFPGSGFGTMGVRDAGGYGEGAGIWVRVTNLPLSFNYREVRRFFVGCDIPPDGLKLINDRSGKRTGLAYIKFSNPHNVETALDFSGRVVENVRVMIERCSRVEFDNAVDGYKPSRGGHVESRDRSRSPLRRRSPDREEKLCVVVKKLPPRTTELELKAFFDKAKIARNGGPILEIGNDGQLTGCGLIEFESYKDFEEAMFISKQHKLLNGLEVKVIGIKKVEFEERTRRARLRNSSQGKQTSVAPEGNRVSAKVEKNESKDQAADSKVVMTGQNKEKLEKSEPAEGKPCCVEMQGVPWTTNASVVKDFFKGLSIVDNGIHVVLDKEGRAAGPVYVEFANPVDCKKGLERNRQFIGKRYINVVLIGKKQMMAEVSRQQVARPGSSNNIPAGPVSGGPAGRGAATKPGEASGGSKEVTVSLKNLNFQTQLEDILEFFRGYHPLVDSIKLQYKDGKPTGDGLTTFPNMQEAESVIKLLNRKPLLGRPVLLSFWT